MTNCNERFLKRPCLEPMISYQQLLKEDTSFDTLVGSLSPIKGPQGDGSIYGPLGDTYM